MKKLWNKTKGDWKFWVWAVTTFYIASIWVYEVSAAAADVPVLKNDILTMKGDIKTINQRVEDIWKAMRLDRLKK